MRGPMHRRDLLLCLSKPANVSLSPMLAKVLDYPLECLNEMKCCRFWFLRDVGIVVIVVVAFSVLALSLLLLLQPP